MSVHQPVNSTLKQLPLVPVACIEPIARVVTVDSFDDEIWVIGPYAIDGTLAIAEVMIWDGCASRLRSLPLLTLEA
jgi:hypothetical protein